MWVVGLGTVGQWLLRALHSQAPRLAGRYGFVPKVVGVANSRDGFVYRNRGCFYVCQATVGVASSSRKSWRAR